MCNVAELARVQGAREHVVKYMAVLLLMVQILGTDSILNNEEP